LGLNFALKYCRDQHQAKDISQDTIISLFKTLKDKDRATLETFKVRYYFFKSIKNSFLTDIKRGARREEVITRYISETDDDNTPSIEDDMTKEERKKIAIERVNKLPDNQRTCFMLQLANHSYAEIAELVEKTEDQVRGLIYRARLSLRTAL